MNVYERLFEQLLSIGSKPIADHQLLPEKSKMYSYFQNLIKEETNAKKVHDSKNS